MDRNRWLPWCLASILACADGHAMASGQEAAAGVQSEDAGVPVSEATLDEYVGTYVLQEGTEVRVWREEGRLMLQARGQAAWPLAAESESVFRVVTLKARVSFGLDAAGHADHLVLTMEGKQTRAVRR
jgi:hypothetical protein